ncbi:hypothetical protein BT69DRAFT_942239, partial [Atractiella rhizophila]
MKFLPVELFRHVLSFLTTIELVPVSLACRAWNRCAESFMYSSVSLSTSIETAKLAATLENRIYLTHWVSSVSLGTKSSDKLEGAHLESWESVLAICPNVRTVHFKRGVEQDTCIKLMRPFSQNLLEISIDETTLQHRKGVVNSTNLLGYCLGLPNLQKLSVTRINLPLSLSPTPIAPLQRLTWIDYSATSILPAILNACGSTLLYLHLARLAFPISRIEDASIRDLRIALRQLHILEEFTFEPNPYSGVAGAMDNLVSDVSMVRRLKCGRRSYTRALLQRLPDGLELLELEAT